MGLFKIKTEEGSVFYVEAISTQEAIKLHEQAIDDKIDVWIKEGHDTSVARTHGIFKYIKSVKSISGVLVAKNKG
ncbi:MAG TPA: hypothetical protein VEA37_03395 [Flavobacterium sp.]|nr:hypothetical protein [Flavobacterium sp.]